MVEIGFATGPEAPNTLNFPSYEMSHLPSLCENTRYYLSELPHKRKGGPLRYRGCITSIPVVLSTSARPVEFCDPKHYNTQRSDDRKILKDARLFTSKPQMLVQN